jgi:LPXTG-site transpeptidase (sortase) family protein
MFSTTARRSGRDVIRAVVYLIALALVIIFLALSFRYLQSVEAKSLGTIPQVGPASTVNLEQEQAPERTQAASFVPAVVEEQPAQPAALSPPLLGPGGHIYIPSIGVDLPLNLMASVDDQAPLDRGPSWMQQTGSAGRPGNCVIAGHRSTYTQPFHDLDQLAAGDVVVITDSEGGGYTYQVDRVFPVDPSQVEVMSATPNATFTLITCHPLGSSRQRLIVQGHLVQ